MAHLSAAQLAKGVVAASSGNHAQGVALAAQKLGTEATIVMPRTTPAIKVDAVKARGAKSWCTANLIPIHMSTPRSWSRGQQGIHPSLR